jgi:DNA-binding MarR family transcriptional regulator
MATELDPVDALAQVSFLVQGSLERRAGEHGISLIQTRLLGILRDRTPTINELAELLGQDKSSTSGLVDRAQNHGLVRRVPSQIDRRSVRVRLTNEGREVVHDVAELFAADIAAMLEPLSAETRTQLTTHLSQVVVADAAARGIDLLAAGTP